MGTNFYNDLDLKYAEIGIAMEKIDRQNPGKISFCIPVMTPTMGSDQTRINKIIQRDKSNIQNVDKGSIDLSDLEISNTIQIEIPRELCCIPNPKYRIDTITDIPEIPILTHIEGKYEMEGNGTESITGKINASGTISLTDTDFGGSASGSGSATLGGSVSISSVHVNGGSGDGNTSLALTGTIAGQQEANTSGKIKIDGEIKANVYTKLIDYKDNRYIPIGSKWLIMFIGGDINMPVVVCRLPDGIC